MDFLPLNFNTPPRTGRNRFSDRRHPIYGNFNTPPRTGRNLVGGAQPQHPHISIHLPARGGILFWCVGRMMCLFQYTSPHGEEFVICRYISLVIYFNTPPRTGRNGAVGVGDIALRIFQYTSPHGEESCF